MVHNSDGQARGKLRQYFEFLSVHGSNAYHHGGGGTAGAAVVAGGGGGRYIPLAFKIAHPPMIRQIRWTDRGIVDAGYKLDFC
jgi:hypothetical protein